MKCVKNEFLTVEDISNINDGKLRHEMSVKAYNETRVHGRINGLTMMKEGEKKALTNMKEGSA
jgi:hypothetical protein